MNPKTDFFFNKANHWQEEYNALRKIGFACGLTEELKWGCPCYTFNKNNIVLIHGFKAYCALLVFKGALLKDEKEILIQQTKNVQSARQIRFKQTKEIISLEPIIKAYIFEAIEVEKAGLKVTLKKTSEYEMPVEFKELLDKNTMLNTAFYNLTPGRQRAYLHYFSQAKQTKTRIARIEKCMDAILNGKGLNE